MNNVKNTTANARCDFMDCDYACLRLGKCKYDEERNRFADNLASPPDDSPTKQVRK